jgi:signal transduction histidine kinase
MNKNRKHRRILLMMIISQSMLSFFIVHWLRSQYSAERDRLVEKLTTIYMKSSDEVLDTILFRSLVRPVISGGEFSAAENYKMGDTAIHHADVSGRIIHDKDLAASSDKRKTVSVIINTNIDTSGRGKDSVRKDQSRNEILLRSVKMIVSRIDDSASLSRHLGSNLNLRKDTVVFMKGITHQMDKEGFKFNIFIDAGPGPEEVRSEGKTLLINPEGPLRMPAMAVKKYTWYLFGRILPQAILALILFLITGLAFILSYRSIREQVRLNILRNEFVSNITHELKTPVATLSASMEALGRYNMKNEPKLTDEYIELASREIKRLDDLINKVLDHSVLESANQILHATYFDLIPIVKEVSGMMQHRLPEKGSITTRLISEKLEIHGDPMLIKGALLNLIDNSIKYCTSDPVIIVSIRRNSGSVVIEVSDNGPGIPEEYVSRIFEKFFRIPSGNVHNVKGYGLGLSYACLVTELHKGKISVKNLDRGCRFIITLPV